MTEYDYAVVENTLALEGQNPLVACICLQQSPGYYGKVYLNYGKPEAVASHPGKKEGTGGVIDVLLGVVAPFPIHSLLFPVQCAVVFTKVNLTRSPFQKKTQKITATRVWSAVCS